MDYCDFTATSGLATAKTNSTRFLNFQLDRFYAIRSLQWLMNIWVRGLRNGHRFSTESLAVHFLPISQRKNPLAHAWTAVSPTIFAS